MTCVKCGGTAHGPQYHANYENLGERLVWLCACGYRWATNTKDASKAPRGFDRADDVWRSHCSHCPGFLKAHAVGCPKAAHPTE